MTITLKQLAADWLACSDQYRPSAFWFWNSRMTHDEISHTMAECARRRVREVLFHPVHGMEVEYLSDEFFSACRFALSQARQHGLGVWIYDEFGWPSGAAGGRLLDKSPQHRSWFLQFAKDEAGRTVAQPIQSDRVLDNVVGASWAKGLSGYLDTLCKDAVRAFIELTHEQYYRHCSEFFGDTIQGFFTDEPATMVGSVDQDCDLWTTVGLPWTPTLPARFKEQSGYDVAQHYPALAAPEPSAVKRDYWLLVKQLHIEAYHRQLQQWCHAHHVKHTGHLGENTPLMQTRFAGSAYQALSCMDEPGVDMLTCQPPAEDRFGEQVLVASIARHAGRSRVYCEAFGVAGFDIRLSTMLHAAEMLAIQGVDDIALMGFQQSLAGIRKRTYWPPIFHQAPWWFCYDTFRDGFARAVALPSCGVPQSRYAILYPQEQLEQTDIRTSVWDNDEPVAAMIEQLGRAIYRAGETFEFVFPEILTDARADSSGITFPHATYCAILAPKDIDYGPACEAQFLQLEAAGALIIRETIETTMEHVKNQTPSWSHLLDIDQQEPALRIHRFHYADGDLFTLRNVTDIAAQATITSPHHVSQWDPTTGQQRRHAPNTPLLVNPHTTRYITVSESPLAASATAPAEPERLSPIDAEWRVTTESPNLARFSAMHFHHPKEGWLPPEPLGTAGHGSPAIAIPASLAGHDTIHCRAQFNCQSMSDPLGIAFEQDYLRELTINDSVINLQDAQEFSGWDASCRMIDIRDAARSGKNDVKGTLAFPLPETTIVNDGFFRRPLMPSFDVFLVGSFRLINEKIQAESGTPTALPFDAGIRGWAHYCGVMQLTSNVDVPLALVEQIRDIQVNPLAEDAMELLLDGRSLGQRITAPYRFTTPSLAAGPHEITIRLATTTANLFDRPAAFGIESIAWLVALQSEPAPSSRRPWRPLRGM